jgi:hypothetical protein
MCSWSRLSRRWANSRWHDALRVDRGLAELEGLAAGTGLLTGDVVGAGAMAQPCPVCAGPGEAVVIDLVAHQVSRRCLRCDHRWDALDPVGTRHS